MHRGIASIRQKYPVHYLDMVGVTGSIPVVPTTQSGLSGFFGDCRESPAIGGYFSSAILNSPVSALKSSHFGPVSLVRKFPFLAALRRKFPFLAARCVVGVERARIGTDVVFSGVRQP